MLPDSFLSRMRELLAADYPLYLKKMDEPPVRALRIRSGCMPKELLQAALCVSLSPIPYADNAFRIEGGERLGNHPLHHAGAFYLQEPSAMAPVAAAPLSRGMRVLDLCASPGGKSTQILDRIGEGGCLVANEIVASRAATLAGNIERLGYRNAIVTNTDAQTLGEALPDFFDAVLVDAPCSGEGMFRKDPDAIGEWTEASADRCASRSADILRAIAPAVCPGGYLIYSTCTFSVPENEGVLSDFLKTHPDFSLCEIPESISSVTAPGFASAIPGGEDPERMRRFYPHTGDGEGQFLAVLQRMGEGGRREPQSKKARPTRDELAIAEAFLRDTLAEMPALPLSRHKDSLVFSPLALPIGEKAVYADGVTLGTVQKGRLVPHHAFFSAYGSLFKRKLELTSDDPRTAAYLHGDTIPTELADGWGAVLIDGIPLGGIKVSHGMAKNHYPKGLRRMS